MIILGISPLDKDATVSLVINGKLVFAASEERYSRVKQQGGFPALALAHALEYNQLSIEQIDVVTYPFLEAKGESACIKKNVAALEQLPRKKPSPEPPVPKDSCFETVPGLKSAKETMQKSLLHKFVYRMLGKPSALSNWYSRRAFRQWAVKSQNSFSHYDEVLANGLKTIGFKGKVKRVDHHRSHAANAFYCSDFDRALIVTLDGYGTGGAGSVSVGENGKIKLLNKIDYPHSLGLMYEQVTSALGFKPSRHEGKIVGLAAYGDPHVLGPYLLDRVYINPGKFEFDMPHNAYFARYLASKYSKVDVAAGFQWVLERLACDYIAHYVAETGVENVVLSGGVTANVKLNQRIYEIGGVENLFVYPNMGDGGCATGAALLAIDNAGTFKFEDPYLGPEYSEKELEQALIKNNLAYEKSENLAETVAALINSGAVVARFDGRMEYGPRALGNRSIMYHGRDPDVNNWLNKRLGRTEFMPFAPVTLMEDRQRYFFNSDGVERTAEFMTVTLDCTEEMKQDCPAAVHVDGTARPQLITSERNPGYFDILKAYKGLTGIGSLINTSFNMHEEPIVRTPEDAIRAYLLGDLDALILGPFLILKENHHK